MVRGSGETGGVALPVIDKVAWIQLEGRKVLLARSRGKGTFYIPGGKREAGETDVETLVREVEEELAVAILPDSARHVGTFMAQAHGQAPGVAVLMTCYRAEYRGVLAPSGEIEELTWMGYGDRDRVPPVDQVIFDWLRRTDQLG